MLFLGTETSSAALYVLQGFLIHPSYNNADGSQQNDISIVQTRDVIAFGMNVGPICLPFRYSQADLVGVNVYVLGN